MRSMVNRASKQGIAAMLKEVIIYYEGAETLEKIAQRSYGYLIPGNFQDQVRPGFENLI